jgi:hypothetical protein
MGAYQPHQGAPEAVVLAFDGLAAAMTLAEMLHRWPVAVAVVAAHLRRCPGVIVTPDLSLATVATRCGIAADSLVAEVMDAAARADRGECVWGYACR